MDSAKHKNESIIWSLYLERYAHPNLEPCKPLEPVKFKPLRHLYLKKFLCEIFEPWCGNFVCVCVEPLNLYVEP